MNSDNDRDPEPLLFSATLRPRRALGRKGFLAVMLTLAGASFATGVVFLAMGAWPVCGFLGLDVLLVYWAFRTYDRAAAQASEAISVRPSEMRVVQTSATGSTAQWSANPVWVTLDRQTHEELGLQRLFVVSRGRRLGIASFLGPEEKQDLAQALAEALAQAKRGPTRTVFP